MLSFPRTLLAVSLFASALVSAAPSALVQRQTSSSAIDGLTQQIPASCSGLCNSTLTLYNYCEVGNATQCLGICTTDSLNNMYTCINCAITNGNLTQPEYSSINTTVTTLVSTCSSTGISGTPTTSLAPYNSSATPSTNTSSTSASPSASAKTGSASSSKIGSSTHLAAALAGVMAVVALAL